MVQKDVLNADELGAFAEIADHKLGVSPPRVIVHIEIGSWKGWRNVAKSTLLHPHKSVIAATFNFQDESATIFGKATE